MSDDEELSYYNRSRAYTGQGYGEAVDPQLPPSGMYQDDPYVSYPPGYPGDESSSAYREHHDDYDESHEFGAEGDGHHHSGGERYGFHPDQVDGAVQASHHESQPDMNRQSSSLFGKKGKQSKNPNRFADAWRNAIAASRNDYWKVECVKSTSRENTPPKPKHVRVLMSGIEYGGDDYISRGSDIGSIMHTLKKRLKENDHMVVIKALSVFHYILKEAKNEGFLIMLNGLGPTLFNMSGFQDENPEGYPFTNFIKTYGLYLIQFCTTRGQISFPPMKTVDSVRDAEFYDTYAECEFKDLLKTLPLLAANLERLFTIDLSGPVATAALASSGIRLIFRDCGLLWNTLEKGILNLEDKFFTITNAKYLKLAYEIYKYYAVDLHVKASQFFKLGMSSSAGWLPPYLEPIPQSQLLEMEEYMKNPSRVTSVLRQPMARLGRSGGYGMNNRTEEALMDPFGSIFLKSPAQSSQVCNEGGLEGDRTGGLEGGRSRKGPSTDHLDTADLFGGVSGRRQPGSGQLRNSVVEIAGQAGGGVGPHGPPHTATNLQQYSRIVGGAGTVDPFASEMDRDNNMMGQPQMRQMQMQQMRQRQMQQQRLWLQNQMRQQYNELVMKGVPPAQAKLMVERNIQGMMNPMQLQQQQQQLWRQGQMR